MFYIIGHWHSFVIFNPSFFQLEIKLFFYKFNQNGSFLIVPKILWGLERRKREPFSIWHHYKETLSSLAKKRESIFSFSRNGSCPQWKIAILTSPCQGYKNFFFVPEKLKCLSRVIISASLNKMEGRKASLENMWLVEKKLSSENTLAYFEPRHKKMLVIFACKV